MSYTLIIGNKNYSSWSMRVWLLLRFVNALVLSGPVKASARSRMAGPWPSRGHRHRTVWAADDRTL